jgi:hypothetical protein
MVTCKECRHWLPSELLCRKISRSFYGYEYDDPRRSSEDDAYTSGDWSESDLVCGPDFGCTLGEKE